MTKSYIIAHISVLDPESYKKYIALADEVVTKYGGKILASGGKFEILEGQGRNRNALLEFDTFEQAKSFYHSPEYQSALKHRLGISVADIVVVEGC